MARRIKLEQHEKVPWLNGRGFSWNIAMDVNHPNQKAGEFGWRFATAIIGHSGAFSTYNNVDRIITLMRGNGFGLKWGGDENNKLTASKTGDPKLFPGDADTHCELTDGPVQVLNLMVDRDLWRAEANTRTSA
jgi:environmental stress-induced protein Ves